MKVYRNRYKSLIRAMLIASGMLLFEPQSRSDAFQEALIELSGYDYGMDESWKKLLFEARLEIEDDPELRDEAETRLIRFIQSEASSAAKWSLVKSFAVVVSDRSRSDVLGLLENPDTFDLGVYILDSSGIGSASQIGDAIRRAPNVQKLPLINLLGKQRGNEAVSILSEIVEREDGDCVASAIRALGSLGTKGAAGLLAVMASNPERYDPVQVAHARMRCAEKLVNDGNRSEALVIYNDLVTFDLDWVIQGSAYRGLFLLSDDPVDFLMEAIPVVSTPLRSSLIRLSADLPSGFSNGNQFLQLDKLDKADRIQLLEIFSIRGDESIRSTAVNLLKSEEFGPNGSMLEVIGRIGGPDEVGLLLDLAMSADASNRKGIRDALYRLRGEEVDDRILQLLRSEESQRKIELLKAVKERGMTQAAEILLKLAASGYSDVFEELIDTLGSIATVKELSRMVDLYQVFDDPIARRAIVKALQLMAAKQSELSEMVNAIQGKLQSSETDEESKAMLATLLERLRS